MRVTSLRIDIIMERRGELRCETSVFGVGKVTDDIGVQLVSPLYICK